MSSYITAKCRTNLDGYERVEWPTQFVAVPRAGELVRGTGTRFKEATPYEGPHILKVYNVTHAYDQRTEEPFIIVELNKVV